MATLGETSKERLVKYLEFKGVSKAAFYKDTGLNRGLIDNDKLHQELTSDKVATIIAVYNDLSLLWLISGEGSMLLSHGRGIEYPKDVRMGKTECSMVAEPAFLPKSREKVVESQDIPLYSFSVTGGILENIDNSTQYIEDTLRIPDAPKCDGAVRVVGDSMSPTINAGDIIAFALIRDKNYILYGHIYFVDYASEFETYMVCKIVRKSDRGDEYVALHSLNPNYDPVDVRRADIKHLALVKLSIHYHMIS